MLWNMKFSNQYNHISYTKIWVWNWVNTLKPKWTPFRRRHLQVHCSMKIFEFRLKFQWGLFWRVQLTIFQHICVIRPQSVKRCLSNDYCCILVCVCRSWGVYVCSCTYGYLLLVKKTIMFGAGEMLSAVHGSDGGNDTDVTILNFTQWIPRIYFSCNWWHTITLVMNIWSDYG